MSELKSARNIELPKFDIQKAIDYPRSDFDSSSDSDKDDDEMKEKKKQAEDRIDAILKKGGLEINSKGSICVESQNSNVDELKSSIDKSSEKKLELSSAGQSSSDKDVKTKA